MTPHRRLTPDDRHAATRLLAEYASGADRDSLARLFELTAPELHACARDLVRCPDAAEDLVQETFVALLDAGTGFDSDRAALPYLVGILRHKASALLRRRRLKARHDAGLQGTTPRSAPDTATTSTDAEARRLIHGALRGLPGRYREVVDLYLHAETPPREIAQRLGVDAGRIRVQLHRGLRMLRDALPQQWRAALPAVLAALALGRVQAAPPVATWHARPRVRPALLGGMIAAAVFLASAIDTQAPQVSVTRTPPAPATRVAQRPAAGDGTRAAVPAPAAATPIAPAPGLHLTWDDGTPAASVGVLLVPRGRGSRDHGVARTSDARGVVAFGDLPPGDYHAILDRGASGTLTDVEPTASVFTMTVPRGFPVRARVRDAAGAPVADAVVWLVTPYSLRHGGHAAGRTDARGACVVHLPRAGCMLGARAPDGAPTLLRRVTGAGDLELTLVAATCTVHGRVVDERGDAVAGARVLGGFTGLDHQPLLLPDARATTAVDGSFVLHDVPQCLVAVAATAPGRAPTMVPLDARAGKPPHLRLTLPAGHRVRGVVVDARTGAVLPGAAVTLRGHHVLASDAAVADGAGRFAFEGILRAGGTLQGEAPGHAVATLRLDDLDEAPGEVALRLPAARDDAPPSPRGVLAYAFRVAGTGAPAAVSAWLDEADPAPGRRPRNVELLDASGEARIVAGRYWLNVFGEGVEAVYRRPVTIAAGGRTAVGLDLRAGSLRTLQLVLPADLARAPARISMRGADTAWREVSRFAAVPGKVAKLTLVLAPGAHEVRLEQGGRRFGGRVFVTEAPQPLRVVLDPR